MDRASGRNGALIGGALLIVAGVILLIVQQTGANLEWPIWIVAAGLAVIALGVLTGVTGQGFAAVGGLITMVGAVLAVQEATDAYASWTYAWALVAPFGVGLGLFIYGAFTGRPAIVRSSLGPMLAGIVLFLVGFLFFEGMLGLSGEPLGESVAPALLVLLGFVLVVAAFLWPWLSRGRRGSSGSEWSSTGSASVGSGGLAGTGVPGEAGSGAAGSQGTGGPDPQTVAVDLGGAEAAEVAIAFGAGNLTIGGVAAPDRLVDGIAYGGIRIEDGGPGRVRLSTPSDAFWSAAWAGAPFDWRIALTAAVPLRLIGELGASKSELDLSALRVTELRLRTGAADTRVTLPAAAGQTRVDIEGGANTVELRIPQGVAARIRSQMALGSTHVDEARFPRDPLGGWVSPDYATAANRVDIDSRAGIGSLRIV